ATAETRIDPCHRGDRRKDRAADPDRRASDAVAGTRAVAPVHDGRSGQRARGNPHGGTVMDRAFLDYYEQELQHIRSLATEFAELHPNVARNLALDSVPCPDPYVERLLEGVA